MRLTGWRRLAAIGAVTGGLLLGGGGCANQNRGPGETWAIRCVELEGSGHVEQAQALARSLKNAAQQSPQLDPNEVLVYPGHGSSTLYYGQYKRWYDVEQDMPRFQPDPRGDLAAIRGLYTTGPRGEQVAPFRYATLEALPTENVANSEWLLTNAPGYWSLQIGVFYNEGQMQSRRQAAEALTKLLREEGREAYFYHGPAKSIVTVGSFPRRAIETFRKTNPLTGALTFRQKIVDPELLALQKEFPHNWHNNAVLYDVQRDPATGEEVRVPHYSFPVEIPRE